jgi:pyridoxal phosphate enzyme (YggS family)
MSFNTKNWEKIIRDLEPYKARLVAVSKTKPVEDIVEAMVAGQIHFGENYVQELCDKAEVLKEKVKWHMIGHLQTNKVKMLTPYVHFVQSVDSFRLLAEINKCAAKDERVIDCLLQVHIADEESKFGMSEQEVEELLLHPDLFEMENVRLRGLMGMATLTEDREKIRKEYAGLKNFFNNCRIMTLDPTVFNVLSMGMSSDYQIALDCGSTMIRIGSALFGEREGKKKSKA